LNVYLITRGHKKGRGDKLYLNIGRTGEKRKKKDANPHPPHHLSEV